MAENNQGVEGGKDNNIGEVSGEPKDSKKDSGVVDRRRPTDPIDARIYDLEKEERAAKAKEKEKNVPKESGAQKLGKEIAKEAEKVVKNAKVSDAIQTQHDEDKAPVKKTYKIKIDGTEETVDEAELIRLAQLSKASTKRFEEAANVKKATESFMKRLKENPIQALKDPNLGVPKELLQQASEDFLYDIYQLEQMTPEQREIHEIKRENERMKKEKEDEKKLAEAEEHSKQVEHWQKEYDKQFADALKSFNMPKNALTVSRMATVMSNALDAGYDMSAQEAAQIVKDQYTAESKRLFSDLDPEILYGMLGEDIIKKIRQYDVSKIQNTLVQGKHNVNIVEKKTEPGAPTWDEFVKYLDEQEKA